MCFTELEKCRNLWYVEKRNRELNPTAANQNNQIEEKLFNPQQVQSVVDFITDTTDILNAVDHSASQVELLGKDVIAELQRLCN